MIDLYERYANTVSTASVAVYRNVFGLIVSVDDYEAETLLQTKRATYAEIRAWGKREYRLHIYHIILNDDNGSYEVSIKARLKAEPTEVRPEVWRHPQVPGQLHRGSE